ncbi:MAG: hypothetical protein WBO08_02685 [Mycobacterium sp.]|nr:hypothetical protein [Mycobacterium sp.]
MTHDEGMTSVSEPAVLLGYALAPSNRPYREPNVTLRDMLSLPVRVQD